MIIKKTTKEKMNCKKVLQQQLQLVIGCVIKNTETSKTKTKKKETKKKRQKKNKNKKQKYILNESLPCSHIVILNCGISAIIAKPPMAARAFAYPTALPSSSISLKLSAKLIHSLKRSPLFDNMYFTKSKK